MVLGLALTVALSGTDVIDHSTVEALVELARVEGSQEATAPRRQVPPQLLDAVRRYADSLLDKAGAPLEPEDVTSLREHLEQTLKGRLAAIPLKGPARLEAWAQLVREATTPALAQQALDAWLSLPAVDEFGAGATGAWVQHQQLEGAQAFTVSGLAVLSEVGSPGSANGLIDRGEWVLLQLTLTNTARQPWFSTSASVRGDACLWVDERQTSLVSEMEPGGEGAVSLWVRVSADCGASGVLRLSLADTHRGVAGGVLAVELRPTGSRFVELHGARLDTDALGSSDGSRLTELGPGLRFEYSTGLRLDPSDALSVVQRYTLQSGVKALFRKLTLRITPAIPLADATFAPGDDLDGETVEAEAWDAWGRQEGPVTRWLAPGRRGRLWLALDSAITRAAPAPTSAMGKPVRAAAPTPPQCTAPPPAGKVADLVKQYVELVPHGVPKENPAALRAASGYEVLFDTAGFQKAYAALATPAPSQAADQPPPEVVTVVRRYIALPARAARPPERAPEPPPPPRPVAVKPAPSLPWAQLDVGGGVSIFGVTAPQASPSLWGGLSAVAVPTGSLRLFFGPHLVGVAAINLGGLRYSLAGRMIGIIELSGDLGAGYRFRVGRASITPYLALLLRMRDHTSFPSSSGYVGAVVGINLRLAIWRWLGASVDLGVPLAPGGPSWPEMDRTQTPIMDGIGGRFAAGLSAEF